MDSSDEDEEERCSNEDIEAAERHQEEAEATEEGASLSVPEEDLLKNQPAWLRYMPRTNWKSKQTTAATNSPQQTKSSSSAGFGASGALRQGTLKARAPRRHALSETLHPYSGKPKTAARRLTVVEASVLLELSQLDGGAGGAEEG